MMPEQAKPWEMDWSGVKVDATPFTGKAKTTQQDMMVLRDSSAKAEAERDARKRYGDTHKAIRGMGTGPGRAQWLDAITPDEDESFLGSITGFVGAIPRAFTDQEALRSRDYLKTLGSELVQTKAKSLSGPTSDRDVAMLRQSGISPYKSEAENMRILKAAQRDSGQAQARARMKSWWIGKFGSMSSIAPNGMTYEQMLQNTDRIYMQKYDAMQQAKRLPKPPPKRASGPVEIDLNGRRVR